MKHLFVLAILAAFAGPALADSSKFINGDGSVLTDLCIDAIESDVSFRELAVKHGVEELKESSLVCNGLSLNRFKLRYAESETINTVLSFSKADLSPATELCFAAVTGAEDLEALKADYEVKTRLDVKSVTCNDIPLDRFVRRYGAEAFASN